VGRLGGATVAGRHEGAAVPRAEAVVRPPRTTGSIRSAVVVRGPEDDDVPIVLEMWDELRERIGRGGPLAPPASEERLRRLLDDAQSDDRSRPVVAEIDGEVVGMACFVARPIGPFGAAPV